MNHSDISIEGICNNMSDVTGQLIAAGILELFARNGLTNKVKDDAAGTEFFATSKRAENRSF